jgi:hypothetical protein
MRRLTLLFLAVFSVFAYLQASNINKNKLKQIKFDCHFFIENKGQWHSDVLYLARFGNMDAWITKYGVNYHFYKIESLNKDVVSEKSNVYGHRVLMRFNNINTVINGEGLEKLEGKHNYFYGNNPEKYASDVNLFKEVTVKDIYPGIDIRYYFDNGFLRYDFIVHPGAEPSKIEFDIEGSDKTYVKNNSLVFTTTFGEVEFAQLNVYQQNDKKQIESNFSQLKNGNWHFNLGQFDKTQALIIDPLVYSTYLGGSDYDYAYAVEIDETGNVYVTGTTVSADYDVTPGAYQTTYAGGVNDIFVTKLNNAGTSLIYSTYIGGSNSASSNDIAYAIALDPNNNPIITGYTSSSDYPVTAGTFQVNTNPSNNIIITKLNSTGSALTYSTFIGGTGLDIGKSIEVDNVGNIYIAGYSYASDFPVTPGAAQSVFGGSLDAVVVKINNSATLLQYATYVGGNDEDYGYSIAIDGAGNAYITGETKSTNFPVTFGALQTTYGGSLRDAFVTKLNASGTSFSYSTYLGGSDRDFGRAIVVNAAGNAFVTGYTYSANFYTTPTAYQQTFGGGVMDIFVTKLNTSGSNVDYSTFLGGNSADEGYSIVLDSDENAYIAGRSLSGDYPVTPGAYQTSNLGATDVVVSKLNSTGSYLYYSTYIGGDQGEDCYAIARNSSGEIVVAGETSSSNYPVTSGVYQPAHGGGFDDAFVTKMYIYNTSVNDELSEFKNWNIFPSVNNGTFTISSENDGKFELLDINGKIIRTYQVNKNEPKTIRENIAAGVYIIREKNTFKTEKIIIEE